MLPVTQTARIMKNFQKFPTTDANLSKSSDIPDKIPGLFPDKNIPWNFKTLAATSHTHDCRRHECSVLRVAARVEMQ
jgi:hypothetical protein